MEPETVGKMMKTKGEMKMIMYAMDLEEIEELYKGFPLKKNFMEDGNKALEKYGAQAVLEKGTVRIHHVSRPYYSEEDLDYFRDTGDDEEDIAEVSRWTMEGDAFIELKKDPSKGIQKVSTDYYVKGIGDFDDPWCYERVTDEEQAYARKLIEAFLDAAVDAEDHEKDVELEEKPDCVKNGGLSEKALANKKAYNNEYAKKFFKSKLISFNTKFAEDMELLNWIQGQENGNQYIKDLIRKDMAEKMKDTTEVNR